MTPTTSETTTGDNKPSATTRYPEAPPLPEPRSLELDGRAIVKYIDIQPVTFSPATSPTIVLIHGSPGTYSDFRYLVPQLQLQHDNARIIALTLPGFGDSEIVDPRGVYSHVIPLGGAKLVLEALVQLCLDNEHVVLVGHSMGGHTVINVAALNIEQASSVTPPVLPALRVRGVVLLASVGDCMPVSQWPIGSVVLATLIRSELPIVTAAASYAARLVYTNLLQFPNNAPTRHYAAGMVRGGSTDFALIKQHLQIIANVPAFVAYAKNDFHMTAEASEVLSRACCPGPRFAFERGGHNIQKTKADVLAPEIMRWVDEIIAVAA